MGECRSHVHSARRLLRFLVRNWLPGSFNFSLCPHAAPTSLRTTTTSWHVRVTSLCTCAAPASTHCWATLCRLSTSRPFRASRAPSLANRMLVPAPMPELAPVIRATLPRREDTYIQHTLDTTSEICGRTKIYGQTHNSMWCILRIHTQAPFKVLHKLTLHASPADMSPFKRFVHWWWRHDSVIHLSVNCTNPDSNDILTTSLTAFACLHLQHFVRLKHAQKSIYYYHWLEICLPRLSVKNNTFCGMRHTFTEPWFLNAWQKSDIPLLYSKICFYWFCHFF